MSKKTRMFCKAFLAIIGLAVITYILMVSVRRNMMKQPKGEYILLQDALILTEALDGEYPADERYRLLNQGLTENKDREMTYEQFKELIRLIAEEPGNGAFVLNGENAGSPEEIVSLCEKKFGGEYREEFLFLKSDWYQVYDQLLSRYELTETVVQSEVTVLGVGAEVTVCDAQTGAQTAVNSAETDSAALAATSAATSAAVGAVDAGVDMTDEEGRLKEDCLLTLDDADGVFFRFKSDRFRQDKYQTLRVYRKDNTLLTVREVLGRGISLHNIWIMEAGEKLLQAFTQGCEIRFLWEKAEAGQREQVADMEFADGRLQSVKIKPDKINGKLLSIRDGEIELEGCGKFPYEEDMRIYRLYGTLEEAGSDELRIGYDFTDFVVENGRICAGLVTRDEAMENIRVVIKNTGFSGAYHEKAVLTSDSDFTVTYGSYDALTVEEHKAGEKVELTPDSGLFSGGRVYIEPAVLTGRIKLLSVERARGTPDYRGKMEIATTPEGLVVVNEVLLEEYLYSVVPSEMPASYPLEALKAQAVCARTYAYRHMLHSGIAAFGAHVDDSAGFQVYNNIAENAQSTRAVKETSGQLLYYGEELCGAYYYSTSCGFGTDIHIWKGEGTEETPYLASRRIGTDASVFTGKNMTEKGTFEAFIAGSYPEDYESGQPWYRWTYEVENTDPDKILAAIKARYEANEKLVLTKDKDGGYVSRPVKKLGRVKNLAIVKRNAGGVADELEVEGTENTYRIISEHNIRYVLCDGESKVRRQDGSEVACPSLLPSAYIAITTGKEDGIVVGYTLTGGGYGHGVGMSQNGAADMARSGFKAQDILTFFYRSCEVRNAY